MNITEDSKEFRFYIDEKVLEMLDFQVEHVSAEESGQNTPFYYYTKQIGEYLTLISDANDEIENGNYNISILECGDSIKVKHASKLKKLIEILNELRNEE